MQIAHPPIGMSVFELLKAGPGPSSSHTIAPMRAGADFAALARKLDPDLRERARGVRIRLYGSLSATGPGHGTDRAVIAGLMGYEPAACPPSLLQDLARLPQERRVLHLENKTLPLSPGCVMCGPVQHEFPYSNTLSIDLLAVPFPPAPDVSSSERSAPASDVAFPGRSAPAPSEAADSGDPFAGAVLFSRQYYSTGGGFLQWEGWKAEERGRPVHPYSTMKELLARLAGSGLPLDELLMENETAVTGASPGAIIRGLDRLLELMKDTVRRGCRASGLLPGPIALSRKAGVLFERAGSHKAFDRELCLLNAYAFAVAEENASGAAIVTAPTCGAAGVVPAITLFMQDHLHLDQTAQRKGLLAAAAAGFIARENAGIAGAEVGCQGEIGVASAMAAAMLAEARGYAPEIVFNAAETALEHHLGLTCDPVGGYVQIPCIERNAMGAVKAYNAALIACNENPAAHLVSYDDALRAMAETGRDMSCKYKETSTGGLAVCMVVC